MIRLGHLMMEANLLSHSFGSHISSTSLGLNNFLPAFILVFLNAVTCQTNLFKTRWRCNSNLLVGDVAMHIIVLLTWSFLLCRESAFSWIKSRVMSLNTALLSSIQICSPVLLHEDIC